jgi:hypothetical protein
VDSNAAAAVECVEAVALVDFNPVVADSNNAEEDLGEDAVIVVVEEQEEWAVAVDEAAVADIVAISPIDER